jgi:hypothetical protein
MPEMTDESMVCFNIKLKPGLKLWLVDSLNDFYEMWDKYSPHRRDSEMSYLFNKNEKTFWEFLSELGYDGVELTDNGQWETRYKTFLYGWDCECLVLFSKIGITVYKDPPVRFIKGEGDFINKK